MGPHIGRRGRTPSYVGCPGGGSWGAPGVGSAAGKAHSFHQIEDIKHAFKVNLANYLTTKKICFISLMVLQIQKVRQSLP